MPRNHISTSFTFSKVLRLALVVVFAVGFMAVIVQSGSICKSDTIICARIPDDRNLLDFIDPTVEA